MITQTEINNIGFSVTKNIKKLINAGVITQRTISSLLNKNHSTINIFLNTKHTIFYKKTIIGFYNIKDELYRISCESIKAKHISVEYINVLNDIINELNKLSK